MRVHIKRGSKSKQIGEFQVVNSCVTVPANMANEQATIFTRNKNTGMYDNKTFSFELYACKSVEGQMIKVFDEMINVAEELNKEPESKQISLHVPDLKITKQHKEGEIILRYALSYGAKEKKDSIPDRFDVDVPRNSMQPISVGSRKANQMNLIDELA